MKILLIDLENCPNQINELLNDLANYDRVVMCYAQSNSKISIDWIFQLTTAIKSNRLKVIKMPNGGKNSADFGIAFWAGVFMAKLPKKTHFDILSNDSDLDFVVDLLKAEKRSVTRIGKMPSNSTLNAIAIPFQIYCAYLQKHCHKPAKKETLLNSIKSVLKDETIDCEKLFKELLEQKVVTLNNNKIIYNLEFLHKITQGE